MAINWELDSLKPFCNEANSNDIMIAINTIAILRLTNKFLTKYSVPLSQTTLVPVKQLSIYLG